MRPAISAIVIVTLLVAASLGASDAQAQSDSTQPPPADTMIVWTDSYEGALTASKNGARHILLIFETEWCRWSEKMRDSTWSDRSLDAMGKKLVYARIDADLDTTQVARFHVMRYPTMILLTETAAEVDRWIGYRNAEQLKSELTDAFEGANTMWDLERRLTESRNDPKVLFQIGREYIERGEPARGREFFERARMADRDNLHGVFDDILFAEAQLHRQENNWYKSIETLRQLIKKYPDSEWREDAELYSSWLYAMAGDTTEAVKRYKSFLEVYSSSSETQWVQRQVEQLEAKVEPPKSE